MSRTSRIALMSWALFKIAFLLFVVGPSMRRNDAFRAAQARWEDAHKRGDLLAMQSIVKELCVIIHDKDC